MKRRIPEKRWSETLEGESGIGELKEENVLRIEGEKLSLGGSAG